MGADQFLERWLKTMGSGVQPPDRVWVDRFCREGSALLAHREPQGGSLLVLIATDRAAEQVLEFVLKKAFAIDRFEKIWDPSAAEVFGVDSGALAELGVGVWQAYRVGDEARDHAYQVFTQLTAVERNRLPSTVQWSASTGSLIRSLRGAVARGDRDAVDAHLSELRGRRLADRFHFDFLSLWSKARLDPGAVATSSELKTVLDRRYPVPIPRALLQVVAEAVLECAVVRPGNGGSGERGVEEQARDAGEILPEALVERACLLPSTEGAVFRALSSIARGELVLWNGDEELIRERVGSELLSALPAAKPEPEAAPETPASGPVESRELVLGQVVAATLDEPAAVPEHSILQLITFAVQGDGAAAKVLRGWWDLLASPSQVDWGSRSDFFADWLEESVDSAADDPVCWLGWLTLLAAGEANPDDPGSGFSYSELPLFEDERVPDSDALSRVLEELVGSDALRPGLLEVLPALLDAWEVSQLPPSHLDRVSQSLAEVLQFGVLIDQDALSARHGDALVFRFLQVGLSRGLSSQAYRSVVEDLAERVQSLNSPRLLRAMLDVFELLTDEKRPHGDSFLECARAFSQAASRLHGRLDSDELRLFAELLSLAGMAAEAQTLEALLPEEEEAADHGEEGISLAGKKILIYTLVEGAGNRAKARIEEHHQADVRLNHDHAASASLKSALEWADIVISVTRAAQHAATGEIDRQTPVDLLIRPSGKGSSSILNALNDWRRRQSA